MSQYPVENLLREPTEFYTFLTCTSLAWLTVAHPHLFLLTQDMGVYAALSLITLGLVRGYQAFRIKRYHRRLIAMPYYALSTTAVPLSKKWLFLGKGFRWLPHHTQRLHQIKQIRNESFMQRNTCYRKARDYCKNHENSLLTKLFNTPSRFNPFKPDPPVGGSSYLHGLGEKECFVHIPQEVRVGHTFVVGTTRVGKTRLASILINQDIRNGDAVIVVDPKGDLDLVRDMYSACKASARLHDFRVVHLGFPELSAHYNPLKNYDQVSEVATRVTDAIQAEGEGKQFAAFSWKYVNIVAICLEEMKQLISYTSIGFYINRLDQLLMAYSDAILPTHDPDYHEKIEEIIANNDCRVDKYGNTPPPMNRSKAVVKYLQEHISKTITSGNVESLHDQVLIDLFDAAIMDKNYYDKITASVGPVLSEINKSNASRIFSFHKSNCEIELMSAIKNKQVIYIGLDSLTNPNIAQAVGKAFLSDLVSTAGKIYKESNANYRLNLHCDELSEIIQDSFVKILNKAGGAGFQVTAYAQTKQDMEVALGSKAKAEVTEGNLNTLIMLRVKNEETANLLVKVLPKIGVVEHTQVSMVNDTPHGEDGVYFNTTNEDRVQTTAVPMIDVNDIISLPKGQAFVLVNGGELYKVRIPLPVNDGLAPKDIKSAIRAINQLDDNLGD
ncbi:TPA: type IV conjugative transfer system coupling protein TraD [Legionella pneumophila]|nr:type IV conjugative transfer system coupling protein TraD [Legionella pneumophila subsp. pneumophila]HAU0214380.1 type IV conjugative transfer system coupling protein TraD [Legionella pneumophila]HAT8906769.1 type IV conjugative transfer system coupling protein TraD [Legionella pneumophila subsp. pneumophila]HAU1084681.1 type IV conjugative transfer system coupling protein TraD [Legionella pneumophila]HAU1119283.1 type IV conjugative transfer system coupling protein TraD [Legionella pneumoph